MMMIMMLMMTLKKERKKERKAERKKEGKKESTRKGNVSDIPRYPQDVSIKSPLATSSTNSLQTFSRYLLSGVVPSLSLSLSLSTPLTVDKSKLWSVISLALSVVGSADELWSGQGL